MSNGKVIDTHTVQVVCELAATVDETWHHLTAPEALAKWLAVSKTGIRDGGEVELLFDVEEVPEREKAGAVIDGTVSEFVPPRRLAYSWTDPSVDSRVVFDLEPSGEGTRLTVTHSALPVDFVARCGAGWHTHLAILSDHLAGRSPRPFLETFEAALPDFEAELASVDPA
ncbi:MAG: SRPBCC family protein [Phyllobacteriaceae bacterium]|nr:SRPBCC family protein [Phyllobacteriaceae bacterium]